MIYKTPIPYIYTVLFFFFGTLCKLAKGFLETLIYSSYFTILYAVLVANETPEDKANLIR